MNKIDVSVIEYIGRFEDGIMVLLGIMYDDEYFDATFYYTIEDMILTISDEMEEKVGPIIEHPQYRDILIQILKKVGTFREMWPTLKEIDFAKYVRGELEIYEENLPEILPDGSVRKLQ
jgi:hypothetical protein